MSNEPSPFTFENDISGFIEEISHLDIRWRMLLGQLAARVSDIGPNITMGAESYQKDQITISVTYQSKLLIGAPISIFEVAFDAADPNAATISSDSGLGLRWRSTATAADEATLLDQLINIVRDDYQQVIEDLQAPAAGR